jgi:hypothetical protein
VKPKNTSKSSPQANPQEQAFVLFRYLQKNVTAHFHPSLLYFHKKVFISERIVYFCLNA